MNRCLMVSALVLTMLPGCRMYYEFVPSEVPQGKMPPSLNGAIATWLKPVRIYNQFSTVGLFHVLRVSDEVALLARRDRAFLEGRTPAALRELLQGAYKDNQHELIFFMLAWVDEDLGVPLGKDKSPWRFLIKLPNNTNLLPTSINKVMWTPELDLYFGHKYRDHWQLLKLTYPLTGSAEKNPEQSYLRRGPIQMILRTSEHQATISWPAEDGWKVVSPLPEPATASTAVEATGPVISAAIPGAAA